MDNIISDHHDPLLTGLSQVVSSEYEPTPDSLIVGAYYRYVEQGSVPGHELNHWLDTERMLQNDRQLERRSAERR